MYRDDGSICSERFEILFDKLKLTKPIFAESPICEMSYCGMPSASSRRLGLLAQQSRGREDLSCPPFDPKLLLQRRHPLIFAGVNSLGELPPKLRQAVLLIKDKTASGATAEDAETLATYVSGFERGTQGFSCNVQAAMG